MGDGALAQNDRQTGQKTLAIGERVRKYVDAMPFDVKDLLEFEIEGSHDVGDWGE